MAGYPWTASPPQQAAGDRSLAVWTARTRYASSWATRRARITPQQAGLATYGRRRVPGLRREEVAVLAGVSTDYYTRLERGNLPASPTACSRPSPARCTSTRPNRHTVRPGPRRQHPTPTRRRPAPKRQIRPGVQRILDGIRAPGYVSTGAGPLVGQPARTRPYSPSVCRPRQPVNLASYPSSTNSSQRRSTASGTTRRRPPWRRFAPRPAETPTTAGYRLDR